MRLLSVLTLAALLFIPMHAHAQIVGGFGLKLGDVVDVKSDTLQPIDWSGGTVFKIKPPRPLTGFDEYLVYITPLTHKIYQVKAFRHFRSAKGAEIEYDALKKVLMSKYGRVEAKRTLKGRPENPPDGSLTIKRGNHLVTIAKYEGRDIAQVDRLMDEYIYPRVVITYRNRNFKMRDKEFETIHQRQEADGKKHVEEAKSIL